MADQRVRAKTAVVTGSATGIGKAVALRLSRDHNVVVNAKSNEDGGRRTVDEITAAGGSAVFIRADVSTQQGVDQLFEAVREIFGRVTVLVNNAGARRSVPLGSWDEAHWYDMLATNLVSCALTSQAFVGQLDGARAAIVNVSSARGIERYARIGSAAYSAAKAGVINLTGALAKALAPQVTVNVVSPGFVETRYFQRSDLTAEEKTMIDGWRKGMPIKRFMDPDEIAAAVIFLAKEPAMTGANLVMDGGWTLTVN